MIISTWFCHYVLLSSLFCFKYKFNTVQSDCPGWLFSVFPRHIFRYFKWINECISTQLHALLVLLFRMWFMRPQLDKKWSFSSLLLIPTGNLLVSKWSVAPQTKHPRKPIVNRLVKSYSISYGRYKPVVSGVVNNCCETPIIPLIFDFLIFFELDCFVTGELISSIRSSFEKYLRYIHRTGSMKHGWIIILDSSVWACNTSGADIRRRDLAQLVIVNVVAGGEFWNFWCHTMD